MDPLRVSLLGTLRIRRGSEPHAFAAPPKTGVLLALLLLKRGQPVTRRGLAEALWPDEPGDAARANLRRHVYHLLRALPAGDPAVPWLLTSHRTIGWNPAAPVELDVERFELELAASRGFEAARLYDGDLLLGRDEECLATDRARLRELHLAGLVDLLAQARRERRYDAGIVLAKRILAIDQGREDVVRELVAIRFELEDRAGALAEFDSLAAHLWASFGLVPMAETVALRDAVLAETHVAGAINDARARIWCPTATPTTAQSRPA